MDSSNFNLVDAVIDEVALEGLDGITLEALSQRLCVRLKEESALPHAFMEQLWSIIIQIPDFNFYKLKEPREKLTIIDHFALFEQDSPEQDMPVDIYEHHLINDTKNKIRGSCKTYNTRMLITEKAKLMSLEEILFEYGQHFVIVASQELRENALISDTAYPLVELNEMQYCMLERIGRARYYGELSQKKLGPYSNEDPKIMFYLRKALLQHKLITKQMFHHVGCNRTYSGNLMHLARFYTEKKPSTVSVLDKIIQLLKSKPNYLAEYEEIKKLLPNDKPLNKIVRANFLPKIFHMDLRIPYRTLYPDSAPKDYMQKNQAKEKMLRVVQLVDPNFSMDSLSVKEEVEEEEPYEISMQNQKLFVPLVKQAYKIVEQGKNEGLSQMEFAKIIGATRLQSRSMLRNLSKTNSITTMMRDIGRQRVTKYVSRKFENTSEYNKQFKEEIDKIKEFTKDLKKTPTKKKVQQDEEPVIREENFTLEAPPAPISNVADPLSFACYTRKKNFQSVAMAHLDFSDNHDEIPIVPNSEESSVPEETNPEEYVVLDSEAPTAEPETESAPVNEAVYVDVAMNTNEDEIEETEEGGSLQKKKDKLNKMVYDKIEVKMIVQKPMKIEKDDEEVVGFMEELKNRGEKQSPNMTYRLLKRANLVIATVKEHKVISNLAKIRKVIEEEEVKEGYPVRMDKRSLLRMLHKLAKDNFVKFIKVTMSFKDIVKVVTFICEPSVTQEDSLLVSSIEKAKIEFCSATLCKVQGNKKVFDKLDDGSKVKLTRFTRQLMKSDIHVQPDYNAGKKYGFSPKFIRMRLMHSLLYYLVYEHPGEPQVSTEMQLESLRAQGNILDDDLVKEMSKIYHDEVDWKMFIPPLPKHADWPKGWSLLCDLIFRMPLSLFVKIVKVPYILPELECYLNHPVRRHFLLKDVPLTLQNIILQGRKYIFTIHSVLTRLCYIGLVQFGPQKLKEKDQVFVYTNRRAELWDTTTSAPGYHHIEEKEYPVQKYFFDSMAVVEKYWYDMWNYCINTNLGGRLAVQGKDIVLEDLDKKLLMIYTLNPREPGEASSKDLGFTPGDRKGAAGLDSALFAHLKRNWNWGEDYYRCKQYKNGGRSSSPPPKEPITVNISELAKPEKKKVFTRKKIVAMQQIEQDLILLPRRKSYVRKVLPKKKRIRSRANYDEVDYCALQRMEKLRVDWEPHEDNVLLVCKVAMMYLCPNSRKQLVPFSAVRDVLFQYAKSNNKTSKACHRRVLYMMKQPKTVNSVHLGVEEIKQDYHVQTNFHDILDRVKGECEMSNYQERICQIFKELVDYIINKYYNISNMELRNPINIPMSVEQFHNTYTIKRPKKHTTRQLYFKDIGNVEDIHAATVNSVIHSSMCCGKDRRSWAYELFKIYQQYPEYLLRKAMLKIRADQMVTVKKHYVVAIKKYTHCMPMSSSQYQFSANYMLKFQTKWPYEIYKEADQVMQKIVAWQAQNQRQDMNYAVPEFVRGLEVEPVTGGVVAIIHDMMTLSLLEIDVELPEHVLTLDPRLNEKDEVYVRIAKRYHALLRDLEDNATSVEGEDESEIQLIAKDEMVSQPKRVRFEDPIDDSETSDPEPIISGPIETQTNLKYTSVSQIIQNYNSKKRKISRPKKEDSKQKSHTRIAMLKMREKLTELNFKDSHHAHEYFAVNSFKMLYSLRLQKEDKPRRVELFKGFLVPHDIIPIDDDVTKRIIKKVKENATFPIVQTSYDDFKEEMKDILGIPWSFVDEVYYFIKEKKEFGASLVELMENYYLRLRETLQDILSLLMKEKLILRSGITTVRYIHQMYTDPWLIHSYKILRLDREARTPVPENTMYLPGQQRSIEGSQVTEGEKEDDAMEEDETEIEEQEETQNDDEMEKRIENVPELSDEMQAESEKNTSSERKKRKADESVGEANESPAPKRPCRRRTSLVQQKDIYKSAKMLDLTSAEKIKVVIKPWIRVDGVLNQRVLDRMLGAVLSYCVKHPGTYLSKVQARFAPALQPFHCRELVEILADLECVTAMTLRVSKATLFSKAPTYDLSSKSDLATEDEMIIEPVLGATLKFSTFLNNRSYSSDFLS